MLQILRHKVMYCNVRLTNLSLPHFFSDLFFVCKIANAMQAHQGLVSGGDNNQQFSGKK